MEPGDPRGSVADDSSVLREDFGKGTNDVLNGGRETG